MANGTAALDFDGEFRIGQALERSLIVLFRNFAPFWLLAIVITSPVNLYALLVEPAVATGEFDPRDPFAAFTGTYLTLEVLQFVLSNLLTAILVYGTVSELRGNHVGLGVSVMGALPLLLPVILVAVLVTLIMAAGLLAFIVPGVIAMIVLFVAIPAMVVERSGVFAALGRSAVLTKGNRWRIFGVLLAVSAIYLVCLVILSAVAAIAQQPESSPVAYVLLQWVLFALLGAFHSVIIAVTYHDLRIAQEGGESGRIAGVFE